MRFPVNLIFLQNYYQCSEYFETWCIITTAENFLYTHSSLLKSVTVTELHATQAYI
jgi:hypothetical protein